MDWAVSMIFGFFHQPRDERESRDRQRDNGSYGAQGGADDYPGQRDDHDHQDNKRNGAQQIDQHIQETHQRRRQGPDALLFTRHQQYAQRQADDHREQRGQQCGINRFPDSKRKFVQQAFPGFLQPFRSKSIAKVHASTSFAAYSASTCTVMSGVALR